MTMYTPGHTPPSKSSHSNKDMQFSTASVATMPKSNVDPPRPAKEGYEWVWFPDGYWAERERIILPGLNTGKAGFKWRKRSGRDGSSSQTEKSGSGDHFSPKNNTPHSNLMDTISRGEMVESNAPLPSPYLTEADHVLSLQRPRRGTSDEGKPAESLWPVSRSAMLSGRIITSSPLSISTYSTIIDNSTETIKHFTADPEHLIAAKMDSPLKSTGLFPSLSTKPMKSFMSIFPKTKEHKSKYHPTEVPIHTGPTVADATSHFENSSYGPIARVASLLRDRDNASSPSNGHKYRPRKLFGLAPWQRKLSKESNESVSSSIRDMIRGPTPNNSPASDETTVPSHKSVDYNEMFPGNEAKRIRTPPLRHHSKEGRPNRAFFMDLDEAQRKEVPYKRPATASPKYSNPTGITPAYDKKPQSREWWEVPVAVPRWEDMEPKAFEFDIPDHLPTSPMCPANKKHKSGGTGVCVYHGRSKKESQPELKLNVEMLKNRISRGGEDTDHHHNKFDEFMKKIDVANQ